MTDDHAPFDPDTGELFSTSDAAILAATPQPYVAPKKLYAALMAAVEKMPVWITTDKPGAHKIKYASLKAILEVVRPILLSEGIRIRQGADRSWPMDEGGGSKGRLVPIYTDLIHTETGETDRTIVEIPITALTAPSMGSAITYGRRYSLLAALGLATDEADDDGEAAKPKDLGEEHQDSRDLIAMTDEMHKLKDAAKLAEWSADAKQKRRFNALDETEIALMRQRYAVYRKAMLTGEDYQQPPPEKVKKKVPTE